MKLESLQPGMVVYDAHKTRMGNTTRHTMGVWRVRIEEVDLEGRRVLASWNGNPPRWYSEAHLPSWRLNKPILVKSGLAQRLATRAEIKAMKEQPTP